MWKIVEASKASVFYIYKYRLLSCKKREEIFIILLKYWIITRQIHVIILNQIFCIFHFVHTDESNPRVYEKKKNLKNKKLKWANLNLTKLTKIW